MRNREIETLKKQRASFWAMFVLAPLLIAGCESSAGCYTKIVNGLAYITNGCYGLPGYPEYYDGGGFPEEGLGPTQCTSGCIKGYQS